MLLTMVLVGLTASVFAQGTIVYYNRVTGGASALVYGPESDPTISKTGNTAAGFPEGTQTYGGLPLAGTGFTASLWAGAAGTVMDALTLVPDSFKDFRTGGFAGAINNSGGVIAIPGVGEGASAALQLRVWDNLGGTITSWQAAVDAGVLLGWSPVFDSPALGGLAPPPNMTGLESFNLYTVIPEPSTFVLAGLAAASLLIFRRRK